MKKKKKKKKIEKSSRRNKHKPSLCAKDRNNKNNKCRAR